MADKPPLCNDCMFFDGETVDDDEFTVLSCGKTGKTLKAYAHDSARDFYRDVPRPSWCPGPNSDPAPWFGRK